MSEENLQNELMQQVQAMKTLLATLRKVSVRFIPEALAGKYPNAG